VLGFVIVPEGRLTYRQANDGQVVDHQLTQVIYEAECGRGLDAHFMGGADRRPVTYQQL
jgi:hypothetical protein